MRGVRASEIIVVKSESGHWSVYKHRTDLLSWAVLAYILTTFTFHTSEIIVVKSDLRGSHTRTQIYPLLTSSIQSIQGSVMFMQSHFYFFVYGIFRVLLILNG